MTERIELIPYIDLSAPTTSYFESTSLPQPIKTLAQIISFCTADLIINLGYILADISIFVMNCGISFLNFCHSISNAKKRIDDLEKQFEKVKGELDPADPKQQSPEELRLEINSLKKQLEDADLKIAANQKTMESLREETYKALENAEAVTTEGRAILDELTEARSDTEALLSKAQSRLDMATQLNNQTEASKTIALENNARMLNLMDRLTHLKQEASQLNFETGRKLDESQKNNACAQRILGEIREAQEEMRKELDETEANFNEVNEKIGKIDTTRDKMQERLTGGIAALAGWVAYKYIFQWAGFGEFVGSAATFAVVALPACYFKWGLSPISYAAKMLAPSPSNH